MNTEINMNQVNIVVAELNRLFNSSTGAGPKNLYLELDKERMANLELISYSPVVDINPIEFARFLAEWDALDIVKELRGKDYLTQCEILVPVALKSQETLGMSVIVNAAALRPGQKVVRETFWHGLCYTPDGVAHTPESYYLSEKPVRIHGPCELRPSLIEAMEEGLIDSNFELPDLTKPMGNHKQALLDILTPEQRALAEELIKSRGMSKEVDYSDCRSEEDIKA